MVQKMTPLYCITAFNTRKWLNLCHIAIWRHCKSKTVRYIVSYHDNDNIDILPALMHSYFEQRTTLLQIDKWHSFTNIMWKPKWCTSPKLITGGHLLKSLDWLMWSVDVKRLSRVLQIPITRVWMTLQFWGRGRRRYYEAKNSDIDKSADMHISLQWPLKCGLQTRVTEMFNRGRMFYSKRTTTKLIV